MSQRIRLSPLAWVGSACSTKATWRQRLASSPPELSYDHPVKPMRSSGTPFHSLQATSQALQPMQIDVSVKNPTRGWRVDSTVAVNGTLRSGEHRRTPGAAHRAVAGRPPRRTSPP
jgi:hypothetical protein